MRWATGCNARALAERAILPCQKASLPERAFWRRFAKTNATEATPMDIIPLRPGFGAELRGVTLADVAAHDAAYRAVRAVFEDYSVLVFRNQNVTDESQLAFSRRFCPPEITKVGSLCPGTHFVILTTIGPHISI